MQKGVCNLTCIPIRLKPSGKSEMVSMLLYGDQYYIKQHAAEGWTLIATLLDEYEGWINTKQLNEVDGFEKIVAYTSQPICSFLHPQQGNTFLSYGSSLTQQELTYFEDNTCYRMVGTSASRDTITKDALGFINAPYLWGGKSLMGVDCSGYVQTVLKANGIYLKRDAHQQATQGKPVSLEDALPGDLAFFDNNVGKVVHVGMILPNNAIIHAHNSVRIDRLTREGILDVNRAEFSHKLHSIKSYL